MTKTTKLKKLVPDTSVIIEGLVSKKIENNEILPGEILIHEAVLSELEHQANIGRETGYLGIEELKKLREISVKYGFQIIHKGERPEEFEIRHAKSGEIDSLIRDLAYREKATLITADKVQSLVAQTKGIDVILIEFEAKKPKKLILEKFFDDITMSAHLRENVPPYAKKGRPGRWDFLKINDSILTQDEIIDIAKEIVEEAGMRKDGFIEIQRKGSTIVQLGNFRIVITKPPFSDGWEITAVRPVKILKFEDYSMSGKLKKRIESQAEGILIAGAPGHGKSTFAQALAEDYAGKNKIVKTVEAPRDLQLSDNITQYAISHGSPQEIHDILLLSRPDYTIFDEMRNTEDFRLFADMRLAGVGMIGVVHGTNPIDSIQRFIGRIELGVIPQVIDTVVFIKNGKIEKVYNVKMQVKVPSGMTEADLARPVVTVTDFETGKLEFEIYSYGEETVVVPVQSGEFNPAQKLASKEVEKVFSRFGKVDVHFVSNNKCIVYVPPSSIAEIIGKGGKNIEAVEKALGLNIDIQPLAANRAGDKKPIEFHSEIGKKNIVFFVDYRHVGNDADVVINNDYLLTAKVGKKGKIKVRKDNRIGKIIVDSLNAGDAVELRVG